MSLPSLPVLKAVQSLLQTHTGKPFGLMRLPLDGAGHPVTGQYGIVHPVTRMDTGAPFGDGGDWSEQHVQVTVLGERGDQAVWLQDKSREVMIGQNGDGSYVHPLTVVGMKVLQRRLDVELGPGDDSGGIVPLVSRYVVVVTGA